GNARLYFDDVSFDPGSTDPALALQADAGPAGVVGLRQGGSATATGVLTRLGAASGPVALSAVGLPAGVNVSFSPLADFGHSTAVTLAFTASSGAPRATDVPVTILAKPSSDAAGANT